MNFFKDRPCEAAAYSPNDFNLQHSKDYHMTPEKAENIIETVTNILKGLNNSGELSDDGFASATSSMEEISKRADDDGSYQSRGPLIKAPGANDAAIGSSVSRHLRELDQARAAVAPVIGQAAVLAFDSADSVYRAGIRHLGGETNTHPSAYQAIFTGLRSSGRKPAGKVSAVVSKISDRVQVL